MKVKPPSDKVTVTLEPYEVESLIRAAREVEAAYARQSTPGARPADFGPITSDTFLFLHDLANALQGG